MKFSIIIPVHNGRDTLRQCLDAVFSSENKDFEAIVVDDASTDKSADIAKEYPCRIISLEKNKKPAFAKNTGVDNANGEIIVFVDADVIIRNDALGLIDRAFKDNKDIVALTGLLSKECPHKDFFTQYKNLYMHFIFKTMPQYIDFLYGSILAIKKDSFLRFNETLRMEDTELGQRYKVLGKKILLSRDLEVIHLKRYNFKKIIKNDFFVPFWWVKSFLMHKGYEDVFKKKRFAHAGMNQLLSILVIYAFLLSKFLFLILIFFLLNYRFFSFLYKEKGIVFLIGSMFFTMLDQFVMGLGVMIGFLKWKLNPF